ncbi:MAG: M48 family metalloprotease [Proteobacteria bacterium]|nr:M48 family metalloprotease [Pseudomonadota bacterium]
MVATPVKPYEEAYELSFQTPEESRLWVQAKDFDEALFKSDSLYEDAKLDSYLQAIMDRIFPELKGGIRVRVVRSPAFNAFALPNGSIYINTGLLAKIENEAQLATVLAHEGIHFINKHSVKQTRNIKLMSTLSVGIALIGIPLPGDLIAVSSVYGFSQTLETEADREGFVRLRDAGYDVNETSKVFESMLEELKALEIDEPVFFSSHPKLDERIESYNNLIEEYGLLETERGEATYFEVVQEVYPVTLQDEIDRHQYKTVIYWIEKGDRGHLFPAYSSYYLGEAYRQRDEDGDNFLALTAYKEALSKAPDFAPTHRALGVHYMNSNDYLEAKEHFNQYLSLNPNAVDKAYVEQYLEKIKYY